MSNHLYPRMHGPDPDDAALPEPWPEPDAVKGSSSSSSSPRPAIVTDDGPADMPVVEPGQEWERAGRRVRVTEVFAATGPGGERYASFEFLGGGPCGEAGGTLPLDRFRVKYRRATSTATAIVTDDDAECDDVATLARTWDVPSARGKGPTTDEDEEGDEAQGDTNHIPVGPAFDGGSPRYEVEGYDEHDFAIVEAESGRPVKTGIRKRSIAEAIAGHLNDGSYGVAWLQGEAIIVGKRVNGESRGQAAPGFPHPDADDADAGTIDSHSTDPAIPDSTTDSTPIVGPGEWPWPWDARVGLGPESGPIDGPGGYAASDAALLDSLAAYDEGRRRWRLRAWLAGAVGLVAGVVLGVLLCWAAVEACLVYFAFGA